MYFILLGSIGVVTVSFSLNIELFGEQYKTIVGQLMILGYTAGQVIIGVVAIFVRDYKSFHITLAVPCFLLLGSYFIIRESPRWLIARERYTEAEQVVKRAAKFNGVIFLWSPMIYDGI